MANENHHYNVGIWIFLSIIFFHKFVEGTRSWSSAMKTYTIMAENGEVVDCVDIYKQPAFSHPLLRNHTIQMRPSFGADELKEVKKEEAFQVWQKYGKCPKGTIPIARTQIKERKTRPPLFPNEKDIPGNEYAQIIEMGEDAYYGAGGNFDLWKPSVESDGEFSSSQMWVIAGFGQDTNTIEVGWQVRYTYQNPKLFIFWTADNYEETGCYNLECPGFVQTSTKYGFDLEMAPVSSANGERYSVPLFVRMDMNNGNWWLRVYDEDIGYWPAAIFTSLGRPAKSIRWGGEVVNNRVNKRHTSTQMGSGQSIKEGLSKAAEVYNIIYVDNAGNKVDPGHTYRYASRPSCYFVQIGNYDPIQSTLFYYGGPGYSPQCP